MKIAILDNKNEDIGLKILFPEADYYINNTELVQLQVIEMIVIYIIILDQD